MKKNYIILLAVLIGFTALVTITRAYSKPLDTKLAAVVEKQINKKHVSKIGVYFYDFQTGQEIGINENQQFYPSSMFKVPILMIFLKTSEISPSLLLSKVTFKDETNNTTLHNLPPSQRLVTGKDYTINNLLTRMIQTSDNQALALLVKQLPQSKFMDFFDSYGLKLNPDYNDNLQASAKAYAVFFKSLYYSDYLSPDKSKTALQLLMKTNYSNGLKAGTPETITVAHKFGERRLPEENFEQIHDCGIIYYPGKPYLLCVMTEGNNKVLQEKAIKEVAQVVYKHIEFSNSPVTSQDN